MAFQTKKKYLLLLYLLLEQSYRVKQLVRVKFNISHALANNILGKLSISSKGIAR